MNEPLDERDQLWDQFLSRWPIERLGTMTLSEYSTAGDMECFTNWLESRTTPLGSIWGGSAFKFGVYNRKDKSPKPSGNGVTFGTDYAWANKYGSTAEEAFESVRRELVKVANAAARQDLPAIESADLWPTVKWKVAFLYQDRKQPFVVNVFRVDDLRRVAGEGKQATPAQLHARFSSARGGRHILSVGDDIWKKVEELDAAQLVPAAALEYLQSCNLLRPIKEPTEKMAGFETTAGRQLALALDARTVTVFLSPGPWLQRAASAGATIREYAPDKSRHSNLASNAPALGPGSAMATVKVDGMPTLRQLVEAYAGDDAGESAGRPAVAQPTPAEALPLNQIFYGPPGTGKTYRTIAEAVKIVDAAFFAAHKESRAELKRRYDELAEAGAVQFVTFHPSFSYEDFVEGLRPLPGDAGGLRYEVVDGVFKSMCMSANVQVTHRENAAVEVQSRSIWKMSLGNTAIDEDDIFDECIEGGYALLGYGKNIDFSGIRSISDVEDRYRKAGFDPRQLPDFAVGSVATFLLKVQPGDLLVVSEGNFKFRAIGEVIGGYEFAPKAGYPDGFAQKRAVRWLRVYEPALPSGELMKKQFSQKTIYRLKPDSVDLGKLAALLAPGRTGSVPGAPDPEERKVLVIDEINRGNVARIFGELITLLEESKRLGNSEALNAVLPYSKARFGVPKNLYLLGTMNTADRSLTGLDIALRRRFSFVELAPDPSQLAGVVIEDAIDLADLVHTLNARIEALLDRDHCIGHTYFLHLKSTSPLSELAAVFRRQVLPLLQEYFFEDWGRIRTVLNDHRKNPQHRFLMQPSTSIEALLGDAAPGGAEDARWKVNEAAFGFVESYAGIMEKPRA